jgi:AAA domain
MVISLASLNRTAALKPPRILIHGVHGVGKTTFAAGAPDPVFILTEDGLGTLERTFDEDAGAGRPPYRGARVQDASSRQRRLAGAPDPREGLQGPGLELDRGCRLR